MLKEPQRCSIPSFLTFAFLILSGSHAGPFAGFATVSTQPLKQWTLLVPRSLRRISVDPRVAAFSAAPLGCLLANTWLVSFPPDIRTKYFFSPILLPRRAHELTKNITFWSKNATLRLIMDAVARFQRLL